MFTIFSAESDQFIWASALLNFAALVANELSCVTGATPLSIASRVWAIALGPNCAYSASSSPAVVFGLIEWLV